MLVYYKIVELFNGKYFLEENVFNLDVKSVKTTIVSLDRSQFHKYVSPEKELYNQRFFPDPNIITGYSYIRQLKDTSRIFKNAFVINYRRDKDDMSSMACNYYRKWVIKNYLSWRV